MPFLLVCLKIFGFSGEFCLPQFDPEFLVTPESLKDNWRNFGLVDHLGYENINKTRQIPRALSCAT